MNEGGQLYAEILDAIPIPIFLVDDDVRILDLNTAASSVFGLSKQAVHLRHGGEVLHCLNSTDAPEGCGRGPACKSCVIRNSVGNSLKGLKTTRRRMKFEMIVEPGKAELELFITATPLPQAGENAVLLIVEDITEISKLRAIIPICSECKRVRNDGQYWQQVDSYFHDYIGVDFSHGLCPECLQTVYGAYLTETSSEGTKGKA